MIEVKADCHDTMLQHHALWPLTPHDLQAIGTQQLAVGPWKTEFDIPFAKLTTVDLKTDEAKAYKKAEKDLKKKNLTAEKRFEAERVLMDLRPKIEAEKARIVAHRYEHLQYYNAMDVGVTDLVHTRQSRALEAFNLGAVYDNDREIARYACDWSKVGLGIDHQKRVELAAKYEAQLEELLSSLRLAAGDPEFNPASPIQLRKVLIDRMGIVTNRLTATGLISTDETALFDHRDHPFVRDLLEYRGLGKLNSTYVRGMASKTSVDGRLHTEWKKHVIPSGRFATSPNVQNWPAEMREMLIPARGRKIISCDFAALELRISVMLSGQEDLIQAFNEGADIHQRFAAVYFAEIWERADDKTRKVLRTNSKSVTFGDIYQASAPTLFEVVRVDVPTITLEEVAIMQARKREQFANTTRWATLITEQANKDRQLTTPWLGRMRRWPFGGAPPTETTNHPIQGGAGDIVDDATKRWTRELKRRNWYHTKVWPCLQIHDDLRGEALADYAEEAAHMLAECMRDEREARSIVTGKVYPMCFDVEASIGDNHGKYDEVKNPGGLRKLEAA